VQIESQSAQSARNMPPHHHIFHNDVLLPTTFINATLATLKCKLPDDGRRRKHVGAILIKVLM